MIRALINPTLPLRRIPRFRRGNTMKRRDPHGVAPEKSETVLLLVDVLRDDSCSTRTYNPLPTPAVKISMRLSDQLPPLLQDPIHTPETPPRNAGPCCNRDRLASSFFSFAPFFCNYGRLFLLEGSEDRSG
jgi:hypothetical protein